MRSYDDVSHNFSADLLAKEVLSGSLNQGLNACVECCDRWSADSKVALEWFSASGAHQSVSYASLQADAARFANYLTVRGIGRGDVVAGLLPRIPELLVAILGTWRAGRGLSTVVHGLWPGSC